MVGLGDLLSCLQTSLPSPYFAIDANGRITLTQAVAPLNTGTQLTITAMASDAGGLSDTAVVTIVISGRVCFVFTHPFEKRDVLICEHLRRAASTGFPLSKSKSFHPILIKLGEYVSGHKSRPSSITSQIIPGTPEVRPLNCPKLGFSLSKSKSFYPVYQTW